MSNEFYISLHSAVHAGNKNDYNDLTMTGSFKPLASTTTSKTDPDEVYEVALKLGNDYAAKHPDASFTVNLGVLGNTPPYRVYQVIDKLNLKWIKNLPKRS